jgi:hypothetical protein
MRRKASGFSNGISLRDGHEGGAGAILSVVDEHSLNRGRRAAVAAAAVAGYAAATAASLYTNHRYGELAFGLAPLETAAALAVGLAIGRWWTLLLALIVIPLLLLAPYAGETDNDGVTLRSWTILAGPVFTLWLLAPILLGVVARKLVERHGRPWRRRPSTTGP